MAEPESILQLGIEAAREGNKEEARNLFRLLSRQEPNNAQAWLWLAGVAENREERQGALEHVLELEPNNEMAMKGLQALGVRPTPGGVSPTPTLTPAPFPEPTPTRSYVDDDDPFGDEDPFAELDNLSDVMASDTSGPVRRADTADIYRDRDDDVAAAAAAGAAAGAASTSRNDRFERGSTPPRGSRSVRYEDDDDDTVPQRRGMSPLLAILVGLVALGLIGLLIAMFLPGLFGGGDVAENSQEQTAAANATGLALPTTEGGEAVVPTTEGGEAVVPTAEGGEAVVPTTEGGEAAVPTAEGGAGGPTVPVGGVAPPTTEGGTGDAGGPVTSPEQANPEIVAANTPLSSNGWLYDFNQPTYAAPIVGNLGEYAPNNGRFVVVLAFLANTSGQTQVLPNEFFVLKDAQGRVWRSRPEVSNAYVDPGINADLAEGQEVPGDGLTRSVALVFDVAPDATDLVFFSPTKPDQGWLVLQAV